MTSIVVMPEDLVLKIAAGEVVDRPSSAVKELIDNALDAGADAVRIDIREAGLKLISVTDNGSGIAREDLPLALTSHATSKIRRVEDLDHLTSLGFRGEALASIAAVSRLDVHTRTAGETVGSRLTSQFGETSEVTAGAAPVGTRITVSDLFANVPGRKKFVRSLRAEGGHIASVVWQYALARPEVHFILTTDGKVSFESPGTGRLADALVAVYGVTAAGSVIPVEAEHEGMRIEALVSRPQLSRPNRSAIHVSINGRPIASRTLPYVLDEAYSGFLMVGRHPLAAVNISVPPADVDPNVHPSKHEVRLTRDREVTGMVYRAVSTKLMESREATARPLASIEPVGGETMALPLQPPATVDGPPEAPVQEMDRPALRVFGQSNRTFIIAEGPNGIYMIDQHAAHERILFDRFDEASAAGDAPVQSLLEPASVQLSPGQMQALDDNAGLLSSMGLLLEPFGSDSVLVRGVPAISAGTSPVELVLEVLSELETLPRAESPRERALAALACKAAVKAGMALDLQEMRELVMQLERTQRPATCPHGRPTMIHLSHMQLEREFGRR